MRSPTDPAPRSQILDDLRRVIRRIEGRELFRLEREPVETVVGGEVIETTEGPILAVRREYALAHQHGAFSLGDAAGVPPPVLGLIARVGDAPPDPSRLLFLDTETTGLAGGTGTYAFLVGAGYVDGDRFVVVQYFMRDFDEEPALLAALLPLMERASGLVTFNGSGFDVPLLETRFILARRRWPLVPAHVDLLRPARRVWGSRLSDCRLATLEREVLGLVREDDVPGALIPSLYFDFLRRRRAAPLARVFTHNRDDVLSLAALLGWFGRALSEGDATALTGEELAGLGRLLEPADPARGAAYYEAALAAGLADAAAHWVRLRLAWWAKREAQWELACRLWEAAARAETFDVRPWEELAKYHEHRRRDVATARGIVQEALGLASATGAPDRIIGSFAHRLARLDRRLAPRGSAALGPPSSR